MGNQVSGPEKVYKAVKTNNIYELQSLVERINTANFDEPTRKSYFEYKDSEGRTPLLVAAARNYHNIAKLLLEQGADVSAQTTRPNSGTPLHEAVYQRHEAMVELLLQYGANPFVENNHSRTAMDLAITSGNVAVIRALENKAIFHGYVMLKVLTYNGFSNAWKDRHCVVMPRYENPPPLKPAPGSATPPAAPPVVVRKQLWVYKDVAANVPRTRIWLDGAAAFVTGGGGRDGIIRLHPNHEEPTKMYTKYDHGHMLFCEPARSMGGCAADALTAFQTFVASCNGPAPPPAILGLAGVAGRPGSLTQQASSAAAGPPSQRLPTLAPAVAAIAAATGAAAAAASQAAPEQQPAPASAAAGAAGAAAGGAAGPRRPTIEAQPGESDEDYARRLARAWADGTGGPPPISTTGTSAQPSEANTYLPARATNPEPPSAAEAPTAPPMYSLHTAAAGLDPAAGGYGRPYASSDPAMLRPSDWPAPPAGSRPGTWGPVTAPPPPPPNAHGRMASYSEPPPMLSEAAQFSSTNWLAEGGPGGYGTAPQQQQQHNRMHSMAETVVVHPGANTSPLLAEHGYAGGQHSRAQSFADPGVGAQHGRAPSWAPNPPTWAPNPGPAPSANPFAPSANPFAPGPGPGPMGSGSGRAHPGSSSRVSRASSGDDSLPEGELCVICLAAGREVGLLHGASVHKCICKGCAPLLGERQPCPMCRQPIERIIGVY